MFVFIGDYIEYILSKQKKDVINDITIKITKDLDIDFKQ